MEGGKDEEREGRMRQGRNLERRTEGYEERELGRKKEVREVKKSKAKEGSKKEWSEAGRKERRKKGRKEEMKSLYSFFFK